MSTTNVPLLYPVELSKSSLARMASNIAAGLVTRYGDDLPYVARTSVNLARLIAAELDADVEPVSPLEPDK